MDNTFASFNMKFIWNVLGNSSASGIAFNCLPVICWFQNFASTLPEQGIRRAAEKWNKWKRRVQTSWCYMPICNPPSHQQFLLFIRKSLSTECCLHRSSIKLCIFYMCCKWLFFSRPDERRIHCVQVKRRLCFWQFWMQWKSFRRLKRP